MGLGRRLFRLPWWVACWGVLLGGGIARAQTDAQEVDETLPTLTLAAALGDLTGRPVSRIEVIAPGSRWHETTTLRRVRVGDRLTGEVARRALEELSDTGRFASARAEVEGEDGGGVALRLVVVPRRVVASVRLSGGVLLDDEVVRDLGVDAGGEVTEAELAAAAKRVEQAYRARGFPSAGVTVEALETDDERRVVLDVRVTPGEPLVVGQRRFRVSPALTEAMNPVLDGYALGVGDRADADALAQADEDIAEALSRAGWHSAVVTHRLGRAGARATLTVDVRAGPLVRVKFEGNRRFDRFELEEALELEEATDRTPGSLAAKIAALYVDHGYFDARVRPTLRGGSGDAENVMLFRVDEGALVRVVAREFPCLEGERTADDVGLEIDSFLSEALPGAGTIGPVDPAIVDETLGPRGNTGARPSPPQSNPWRTYAPEVYERARRHLQELYRSEGYLSATVGPTVLMRRACDRRSPPGQCRPVGSRLRPTVKCPSGLELPVADDMPVTSCVPDPGRGVRCEPDVVLHIPVKLGPRATLWDLAFEGNRILVETELAAIAELPIGGPLSQVTIEEARRRLLDEYAERGFAFASIELRLDLSPDRTRARARFLITERGEVRVKDIVVRGARRTNESLILGRVAFDRGDLYRRSDVRATEERLATLGVFSSVTVQLEDPEVFAREKVVVVTVRERAPQYLDVRPGFSTGDGFRITFEYGHRNLGGEAIKLTLRVQLGLLPDFLILEDEVRRRFQALSLDERLERRNSASVEFPEVGLGPLFPFGIDGIDVRDNSRDFGLTKDAGIVTLSYRPTTRFVVQLGGSLERNVATLFASDRTLEQYIAENPSSGPRLRVPDGTTTVVAERTAVTWDRRDDPFNATRGTFISASMEHVHAEPEDTSFRTPESDFLRVGGRLAGYLRFSKKGLALALSMRWGQNVQLIDGSKTYPDRLFFFGGVDSTRGFSQDSVIPQDIAERILADRDRAGDPGVDPAALLTPEKVVIRGGDLLLNPRAELRIPIGGVFQTAAFLDSGNLWLDPANVTPWRLRYAAGTGLRATTPVGPLALDLGVNLDRREWEDPFAFHFSIGLF